MEVGLIYTVGVTVLTCLELLSLFLILKFGKLFIILAAICIALSFVGYFVLKEGFSDSLQKMSLGVLKTQVFFLTYCLGAIPLHFLFVHRFTKAIPMMLGMMFALCTVLAIAALKAEKTQGFWEAVKEGRGLNLPGKDKAMKTGDIILCVDKETKRNVVLPAVERFRHMLLLGPTGSGKTSKILLPMIKQDIENHNCGVTVIDPKGDLAEKVYQMALLEGRDAMYFNPILADCPSFNPLSGDESDVSESICTTFNLLNADSATYYKNMNEQLLRNAVKCIKRVKGNSATLIDLNKLIQNSNGEGQQIVKKLRNLPNQTDAIKSENEEIMSYFLNDYWAPRSVAFQNTSDIRAQLTKLISNPYLRKVLNPEDGISGINFDKCLAENKVLAISTAKEKLKGLNKYLGYFLILQFQDSLFARPGDEDTRSQHFLYIDEFQNYANEGFNEVLTQARSYRVAAILATQNRSQMKMNLGPKGKDFLEGVSSNANTLILYPNRNDEDTQYYSRVLGTVKRKKVNKTKSKSLFSPFYGVGKMRAPGESLMETEEEVPRFSVEDLIYGLGDGEVVYAIPKGSRYLPPAVGNVDYLPQSYNNTIKEMVADFKMRNDLKINKETGEEQEVIEAGGIFWVDDVNEKDMEPKTFETLTEEDKITEEDVSTQSEFSQVKNKKSEELIELAKAEDKEDLPIERNIGDLEIEQDDIM